MALNPELKYVLVVGTFDTEVTHTIKSFSNVKNGDIFRIIYQPGLQDDANQYWLASKDAYLHEEHGNVWAIDCDKTEFHGV